MLNDSVMQVGVLPLLAALALAELATLAALWGGGALVLSRLERAEAEAGGLSAALMLIAAALGMPGIAVLGAAPPASRAALAVLLLVLFADLPAARIRLSDTVRSHVRRPVSPSSKRATDKPDRPRAT